MKNRRLPSVSSFLRARPRIGASFDELREAGYSAGGLGEELDRLIRDSRVRKEQNGRYFFMKAKERLVGEVIDS